MFNPVSSSSPAQEQCGALGMRAGLRTFCWLVWFFLTASSQAPSSCPYQRGHSGSQGDLINVRSVAFVLLQSHSQAQGPPGTTYYPREHQLLHQITLGPNTRAWAFNLCKHGSSSPTMSISSLKSWCNCLPIFSFPLGETVSLLLDTTLIRLCMQAAHSPGC